MKLIKSLPASKLFGLAIGLGVLAGCSAKDFVACPQITAPEQATEAFVLTDETARIVDVRFNGVSASCIRKGNGNTLVTVAAGLKVSRQIVGGEDGDVASVPMAAAVIGPNDEVVSSKAFGYRIGFRKGKMIDYPVAEFENEMKPDERLVLMLTPAM